jgi:hypothetical protein
MRVGQFVPNVVCGCRFPFMLIRYNDFLGKYIYNNVTVRDVFVCFDAPKTTICSVACTCLQIFRRDYNDVISMTSSCITHANVCQ